MKLHISHRDTSARRAKTAEPSGHKLTRQGVRDLGNNTRGRHQVCKHFFGPQTIIATRPAWSGGGEIWGQTCLHCGEINRSIA